MEDVQCSKCNNVYREESGNDELRGREVVIKGATSPMEAALLCGAIVPFFSWPHRNFLNGEGVSAAMKITGHIDKKNWPWQKAPKINTFVFATPTAIVIERVNNDGS